MHEYESSSKDEPTSGKRKLKIEKALMANKVRQANLEIVFLPSGVGNIA